MNIGREMCGEKRITICRLYGYYEVVEVIRDDQDTTLDRFFDQIKETQRKLLSVENGTSAVLEMPGCLSVQGFKAPLPLS